MNDVVDLRPIMRRIDSLEAGVAVELGNVNASIGAVHGDLSSTRSELEELRRQFASYMVAAERKSNVQRSETKVGTLKSEIDREFGHHAVVRRSSVGLLQAFDVGNVSAEVARSVSEELMIQTPRYWLAPCLVALAGWTRHDKEMVERSIAEAFKRSVTKTSLFFALVLRRQNRHDDSVRWLQQYLLSLNPVALNRDFAVVLEASAQGAFGPKARELITESLSRWNTELRARNDIVEGQIARWIDVIAGSGAVLDESAYETVATISPEWPAVKAQLESASALPEVERHFSEINDFESAPTTQVNELLDGLLETLVTEFDDDELPLRRDIAFHAAVIDEDGDMDRARQRADVHIKSLDTTYDAVSLQTAAALTPELLGIGQRTQQIAIGAGKADFREALGRYTTGYRQRFVGAVNFVLDGQHSNFATTFGFPGWSGNSSEPEDAAIGRLHSAWNDTFERYIAAARFKMTTLVIPAIVAVCLVVVGFLITPILGFVVLLGGVGFLAWRWYTGSRQEKAAIDEVNTYRDAAFAHSRDVVHRAHAQFVDAQLTYEELDGVETRILTLIDTWPVTTRTAEVKA